MQVDWTEFLDGIDCFVDVMVREVIGIDGERVIQPVANVLAKSGFLDPRRARIKEVAAPPDIDATVTRPQAMPAQRSPKASITVVSGRPMNAKLEWLAAAATGFLQRHLFARKCFGLERIRICAE